MATLKLALILVQDLCIRIQEEQLQIFVTFSHSRLQKSKVNQGLYHNSSRIHRSLTGVKAILKVHKIENFFGFDFEFCVISLLVMLKYIFFLNIKVL